METKTYERRHNNDLKNMWGRPSILSYNRSKRIAWFGHVWKADGKNIKRVRERRIVGEKTSRKTANKMKSRSRKRLSNDPWKCDEINYARMIGTDGMK